jgi:3-hydroxy-D-aspartate aldolase
MERIDVSLIGQPKASLKISTPALILDLSIMEENILTMLGKIHHYNSKLRPHCKNHKSPFIANLQMQAGAIGICCATIGEAEEMANKGLQNILITSEIVCPEKIKRLFSLNERISDLLVVCDNKDNILALAKEAAGQKRLKILLDIDIGEGKTGVKSKEEALFLAKLIMSLPQLQFCGIQGCNDDLQSIPSYEKRKACVQKQNAKLIAIIEELKKEAIACQIVTGGGTASFEMDLEAQVYTDLQAGSYLFMDGNHQDLALTKDGINPFKPSLFVLTSVISVSDSYAITDGGFKAFSAVEKPPKIAVKGPSSLSYTLVGEEQGKISWSTKEERLELGQKILCYPTGADATINLYNYFCCMRDGILVDFWPVQARGLH